MSLDMPTAETIAIADRAPDEAVPPPQDWAGDPANGEAAAIGQTAEPQSDIGRPDGSGPTGGIQGRANADDLREVIPDRSDWPMAQAELATSIGLLAEVALQLDDPVAALEEGADALAEALAAREVARHEQRLAEHANQQAEQARQAEFQQAYRQARWHRVGELVDLGYCLDQAVGITDANEAEVQQRALAAGRNPQAVIYDYALRHGFRPQRLAAASGRGEPENAPSLRRRTAMPPRHALSAMEALAFMDDEEFNEATKGERWYRLLAGRKG